jgi:hypothetical protein
VGSGPRHARHHPPHPRDLRALPLRGPWPPTPARTGPAPTASTRSRWASPRRPPPCSTTGATPSSPAATTTVPRGSSPTRCATSPRCSPPRTTSSSPEAPSATTTCP